MLRDLLVADLLDGRHVVGRKDDRRTLVAQAENLLLQKVGVDRIETRKRLVEDQQLRFVQHRDDELYFLGHTLRKFVHLAVPPRFDAEFDEPLLEPHHRFVTRKPLQAGEEDGLFAHFHLFIQTALLGQIADAIDILRLDFAAVEDDFPLVGRRDAVDDADQRGLARTVGSEQAVNRPLGNRERHIVQSRMSGEALGNVFYFQYLHNRSKT